MHQAHSDLEWPHIQSFLAVAEHKSLSAAAQALGSSQPTLGRHLTRLETTLDIRLFERRPTGLVITEAGLDLLKHAEAMRTAAEQFTRAASGRTERLSGSVCLTASIAFAAQFLPPILTKLSRTAPDLEIELVASDDTGNLLLREADIAIRLFPPTQTGLIAKKIGELQMGAYAAPAYLARQGIPEDLAALREHSVIGTLKRDYAQRSLSQLGLETQPGFFRLRCDDPNVSWELVRAGFGIGFTHLKHGDADPEAERIGADLPTLILPVWLTSHSELKTSKRIRQVFDFLAEELKAVCAP